MAGLSTLVLADSPVLYWDGQSVTQQGSASAANTTNPITGPALADGDTSSYVLANQSLGAVTDVNGGGPWTAKTFMMVLRADSTADGHIWEQGGATRGIWFYTHGGRWKVSAWNDSSGDADPNTQWGFYIDCGPVVAGVTAFVVLTMDLRADGTGEAKAYFNGTLVGTFNSSNPAPTDGSFPDGGYPASRLFGHSGDFEFAGNHDGQHIESGSGASTRSGVTNWSHYAQFNTVLSAARISQYQDAIDPPVASSPEYSGYLSGYEGTPPPVTVAPLSVQAASQVSGSGLAHRYTVSPGSVGAASSVEVSSIQHEYGILTASPVTANSTVTTSSVNHYYGELLTSDFNSGSNVSASAIESHAYVVSANSISVSTTVKTSSVFPVGTFDPLEVTTTLVVETTSLVHDYGTLSTNSLTSDVSVEHFYLVHAYALTATSLVLTTTVGITSLSHAYSVSTSNASCVSSVGASSILHDYGMLATQGLIFEGTVGPTNIVHEYNLSPNDAISTPTVGVSSVSENTQIITGSMTSDSNVGTTSATIVNYYAGYNYGYTNQPLIITAKVTSDITVYTSTVLARYGPVETTDLIVSTFVQELGFNSRTFPASLFSLTRIGTTGIGRPLAPNQIKGSLTVAEVVGSLESGSIRGSGPEPCGIKGSIMKSFIEGSITQRKLKGSKK